jgi:dTDP-4-dehydrorhamnose reductase
VRILVTGVSGQVGGALIARLRGDHVIAADRTMIDFSRPDAIPETLDRLNPSVIINAAAYADVDQAENESELCRLVNSIAPGKLAQWAASRNVPLIHFSTDYVFDGNGEAPWRERDKPRPLSVYGHSKLEGELAVQGASGSSLIVRTSWVYTATGRNFLRTIARLARERKILRIVDDQIGAPTPAGLLSDVVARMLFDLDAFRDHCSQCNGIVHCCARGETSWYGFACAIVDGLRSRDVDLAVKEIVPIRAEEYPSPARRPHNSRLDLSTLEKLFQITPPYWRPALESELDQLAIELR